jgi:hypothetical protein
MKLPIVLFNPKSCRRRNRRFPLSIYALIPLLREAGYEPLVLDGNLSRDPIGEAVEHLRSGRGLLATTVMPGPQVLQAYEAAVAVRKHNPEARIVWGGYFASMHTATCLKGGVVDYVVKGRGEHALLELANQLSSGADGRATPGVCIWNQGELVQNPAPPLPPPEEIPQFDYTGVPVEPYLNPTYLGRRTAGQNISYGCAWACNFCAVTAVYGRRYKALTPETAAKTLHLLADRWGVDSAEFYDNDFFINVPRTVELAEQMPRNWRWWAYGRCDEMMSLTHAQWSKLRQSGMSMVYMGAESGSISVLKRMHKDLALEETLEAARRFRSYGVVPEFSFVLGNPVDPETDVRESIEFIRKLQAVNPACEIIIYKYTPMPVSGELFQGATERGFRYPDTLEEWLTERWQSFSLMRDPRTPWLPPELARRIDEFDLTLQAYHPSPGVMHVSPWVRTVLKGLASWRYHTGYYRHPYELKAALKLARYAPLSSEGFPRERPSKSKSTNAGAMA